MISLEYFYLAVFIMVGVGAYVSWKYGEQEYNNGLVDAVQLHNEGVLTYDSYEEDGVEMIDIKIKPQEVYNEE